MRLPLPLDIRKEVFREDNNFSFDLNSVLKTSNLGLLFNKFVFAWTKSWGTEETVNYKKINKKTEFQNKILGNSSVYDKMGKDTVFATCNRQEAVLQGLQSSGWHVESFNATTDSRLIIGLGGTSVIETGMTLHPLYGFPYLPGSGLKGLARAYAEIGADAAKDELLEIFGSEDKAQHSPDNRQGKVFFMDGLPTTFPKLELDIMNPHYGEYYQGNKPPADYLNPVPVTFLTVAQGQPFSFAVYSRDKELAEKAKSWLIAGLTDLGAGGKTNVGYGYFKIESPTLTPQKNKPVAIEEDNSLASRLNAVKNQQTFVDFMKGIKQDEIESLRGVSLKESGINIGFIDYLESVEVPTDIKMIIAKKILDVTTPNKKWDEKKHEKYKKLQLIAGVDNV